MPEIEASSPDTNPDSDPRGKHSSDQPPVFSCEDLRYSYLDRFVALDGVNLRVEQHESVALVGANGCGKSTLLKILDGLLPPTSGVVQAFGDPLTEDALADPRFNHRFRSRVGFVFQNSDAQVFSPTVREEIVFGCLHLGFDHDTIVRRVDDVLDMLDLVELADRAPFQLSGGQKKKVAIAAVLVTNPEVVLFDEPTAALDPRSQHWLIELMCQLRRAGKTLVMATHDLENIPALADRCVLFSEDHRIVAELPAQAIFDDRNLLLDVNVIHERTVLPW